MQADQEAPKKNLWSGLFKVMDKLHIKKFLTRSFIYHPPKTTYEFRERTSIGDLKCRRFVPKGVPQVTFPDISIGGFKIYSEKKGRHYMTPLIYVQNQKPASDWLILYSHGNSSDLGTSYLSAITMSRTLHINVLAYDYTGYGISPHKASETNTYLDIQKALGFAVFNLGYPLHKIILVGFSLGSGPTVEIAKRFPSIPFVVLFAPLASSIMMLEKGEKQISHQNDIYANIDKIDKIKSDLLIVHGTDDSVIPHKHGELLNEKYEKYHNPDLYKCWIIKVDNAGHNDLISAFDGDNTLYKNTFMDYFTYLMEKNGFQEPEADGSSKIYKDSVEVEEKILKEDTKRLREFYETVSVDKKPEYWGEQDSFEEGEY